MTGLIKSSPHLIGVNVDGGCTCKGTKDTGGDVSKETADIKTAKRKSEFSLLLKVILMEVMHVDETITLGGWLGANWRWWLLVEDFHDSLGMEMTAVDDGGSSNDGGSPKMMVARQRR